MQRRLMRLRPASFHYDFLASGDVDALRQALNVGRGAYALSAYGVDGSVILLSYSLGGAYSGCLFRRDCERSCKVLV